MSGPTVVCRRCGAANAAGDQFCGSCGAFLEWEGEPVDDSGPAAQTPTTPVFTPPVVTPSTVPIEPAEPSVACPSCRTLNPASRTFCRSCGTTLPSSAPTETPAVEAPRQGSTSAAADEGGLPGWLPIVAGAGVLVGIAIVVFAVVLRPAPPPPAASAFPSATFTPTLAPTPSPEPSAGASASLPTRAPSAQLTLLGARASSVVGDRDLFQPAMAIDGALDTCWQEGATEEAGEWLEVTFEPSRLDYLVIYSGYQLSHDAYLANLRPETVLVSVNGGPPEAFVLADSEQPQRLDLEDVEAANTVRIEIVTTFPSEATAYGGPFDDLAISEVRAFGTAGG
ncbi:MAG TPA: zinc ribbon domain-containing protein [Candidatus Limnocylindrales bacterium]|nr:zinc ribbon domain-containing protein [Candidatus Limnocylindrales bacterium]